MQLDPNGRYLTTRTVFLETNDTGINSNSQIKPHLKFNAY